MLKFVCFLFAGLTIFNAGQAFFSDSPYKDVTRCDMQESCWSFVDGYMLEIIDRFIESDNSPCNFFDYAVERQAFIGKDQNNFDYVESVFDLTFEDFLKKSKQNNKETSDVRNLLSKLQYYYEQCELIKDIQEPPILEHLPKLSSLIWPDWKRALKEPEWRTNFPWINYIAGLRLFGLNRIFFEEFVTTAYNDSSRYVVELKIPEDNKHENIPSNVVPLLMIFNLTDTGLYKQQQFLSRIEEFVKLSSNLRTMHRGKHGQKAHKQLLTLRKLKELVPNIDWQSYFNVLLQQSHVTEELPIQISNLNYFKDIGTLIDQTDDKALAFYILIRLLNDARDMMIPSKYLGGCAEQLSLRFRVAVDYLYERFILTTKEKDEAKLEEIFSALKMRFSKNIHDNKLNLSEEEQIYLQEKLNGMTLKIGVLPTDKDASYYNYYYNDAHTIHSNFWDNQWEILRFNVEQQHAKLFEKQNDVFLEPESSFKQRAQPHFIAYQNRLYIPLEFIGPPFFTHGEHEVFRQSITAFSIARELMRAFDRDGIAFDANGNQNVIGDGILLKSRVREIVKTLEGDTPQFGAERFADIFGFRLVVDTFFNDLPISGNNSTIIIEKDNSKVSYNVREVFFLHFAQYFAGHLNNLYRYDSNADKQEFNVRLNMIVENVPEFGELFKCNEGA